MENILNYEIQLETISSGYDRKTCWVHARGGTIPANIFGNDNPVVVVVLQKLQLTKCDVFYAINEFRTDDLGKTWTGPIEHKDTLGRRKFGDVEICPCDMFPKFHEKTKKLMITGHVATYKNNDLTLKRPRFPCYSIYRPENMTWSKFKLLDLPDKDNKFYNAGAGSAQRWDLSTGEILLPIYFHTFEQEQQRTSQCADIPYASTVVKCRFDGEKMEYIEHGSELSVPQGRGLYEPSITFYKGTYYFTLRNDYTGYVAKSNDGLNFDMPIEWRWDDGSPLGNYNTQQHWVTHSDGLFLVYTRKGANNDNVMRHRAPLFIAQVDIDKLCVIRDTEKVLVPNRGARLGNFGVTNVTSTETWITVTEWMQTKDPDPYDFTVCESYGSDNSVFVARILWETPNKIA